VVIGNDNCAGGAGVGISQNVTVGYLNCLIGSGGNGGLGTVIGQCNKIKSEGGIPGRTSIGIGSENCNNVGYGQDILIGSQNYMLSTSFPAAGQIMLGFFNCVPAGCAYYTTIIGSENCINGKFGTVVGSSNKACNSGNIFDDGSHIFGRLNIVTACCSNIFGTCNCITAQKSNVIGTSSFVSSTCSHVIGDSSCVTAGCAAVLGNSSCSTHCNAVVIGSGLTSQKENTVHVNNLISYGQGASVAHVIGNTGGTVVLDWDNSNVQTLTLTSDVTTLTKSNPINGGVYTVFVTQGSGTLRTVNWGADVKWAGGTGPTLTGGTGATDAISMVYIAGVTGYYANANLNFA
jgi:hypothetical protein